MPGAPPRPHSLAIPLGYHLVQQAISVDFWDLFLDMLVLGPDRLFSAWVKAFRDLSLFLSAISSQVCQGLEEEGQQRPHCRDHSVLSNTLGQGALLPQMH